MISLADQLTILSPEGWEMKWWKEQNTCSLKKQDVIHVVLMCLSGKLYEELLKQNRQEKINRLYVIGLTTMRFRAKITGAVFVGITWCGKGTILHWFKYHPIIDGVALEDTK